MFLAQGIAPFQQGRYLRPNRRRGQAGAGIGGHVPGHVPDRLFHAQVAAGRIPLRMDHPRIGFGGGHGQFQGLDLRVAAQPLDRRPRRLPAQQPRRPGGRRLHHVGALEHRFLPRQVFRQGVELFGQLADLFLPDIHPVAGDGGDQRLTFGKPFNFPPPAPVADLGVVVVGLAGPGQLVHPRQARGVAAHRDAQFPRLGDNRLAAL